MLYVPDCSVVVKWFLPEKASSEASRLLRRYRAGSDSLVAPDLLFAEFGWNLRKLHPEHLTLDDVRGIWSDFRALNIPTEPTRPLADEAMGLAVQHMGSYFDALYVALAQARGCSVVTDDGHMRRAFERLGCVIALDTLTT